MFDEEIGKYLFRFFSSTFRSTTNRVTMSVSFRKTPRPLSTAFWST